MEIEWDINNKNSFFDEPAVYISQGGACISIALLFGNIKTVDDHTQPE
jgi:hypothetical protein